MKRLSGRAQDLADIDALSQLVEGPRVSGDEQSDG